MRHECKTLFQYFEELLRMKIVSLMPAVMGGRGRVVIEQLHLEV